MATQTRVPTTDSATGTWSPGQGLITGVLNDAPPLSSAGDADSVTHGTTAGSLTLGLSPFSVPAGATVEKVSVYGRARKTANQGNSITPWIIQNTTGGTPTYRHATVWALTNGVTNDYQRDWTLDPRTNAAWTVTAVNAIGSNSWGTYSSDASPTIIIYQMYIEVTYTLPPVGPTVTTQAATMILATSANGNGDVTADGGAPITERGVCWGASANPTTADSTHQVLGTTGAYSASMAPLSPSTLYHYRAYAINSVDTSYGVDTEVTTAGASAHRTCPVMFGAGI